MNRFLFKTVLGALLLLPLIQGQTNVARLVGTITDASGAAMPGAIVTVTSDKTALARKVSSDVRGVYIVNQLPPATYDIQVEAAGMGVSEFREGDPSGRPGTHIGRHHAARHAEH